MCHTSLDARELNLVQHALERMTADGRLAPGDDEAARRMHQAAVSPISVGEHCASSATIDFTAPHSASGAAPIEAFSSDVDFARCRQQQARL